MEYAVNKKDNGIKAMRALMTIVFLCFVYFFVHDYQNEILIVSQHILSGGKTHYQQTIGTLLFLAVLWLIQVGVVRLSRVTRRAYWLTFVPSLALLAAISGLRIGEGGSYSWGPWPWLLPVTLLVDAWLLWVARQLQPYEGEVDSKRILTPVLWQNLLAMLLMTLAVCGMCAASRLAHYQAKMEWLISQGNYKEALEVGSNSLETDTTLTMLRVYALAQEGQLGDALFSYPLAGGSESMSPDCRNVHLLLLDKRLLRRQISKPKVNREYKLCAQLLDRNIDGFVSLLSKDYASVRSFPRYYKEALYLYNHLRSHPLICYKDNVLDADFGDYHALARNYPSSVERKNALHDYFGNTYWFYYQYR